MEHFRILKIHLEDARNISPVVKVIYPLEISNKRRLAHCPSIKVVCIEMY